MTGACAGRIKNLKVLEYVCVTSQTRKHKLQTRSKRSTRVSRRLGHATEAISHKIGTTDVPKTCAKCVRSVFSAPVLRVEFIRNVCHTPGTRRASRKILGMFKNFLIPNAHETRRFFATYSDAHRTYTKRTKRACSAL